MLCSGREPGLRYAGQLQGLTFPFENIGVTLRRHQEDGSQGLDDDIAPSL
jgi:hypothetical protein